MWLPRLMRAANEEQEHRVAVSLANNHTIAQNGLGTLVTCDCGHLASCRRTAPLVCSQTHSSMLKHRFTLMKWCCIALLLLIFALIVFSGFFNPSTEISSGSSYLFLVIIFTSLLLSAGLCCLRTSTICVNRGPRSSSHDCHRSLRSHSLHIPASLFSPNPRGRMHSSHHSLRICDSPFYNALLGACAPPLPSYNEAIKEAIFAPPAYSVVVTDGVENVNEEIATANEIITPNAHRSEDPQSDGGSISSGSLSSQSQPQPNSTITAVEVHQSDEI